MKVHTCDPSTWKAEVSGLCTSLGSAASLSNSEFQARQDCDTGPLSLTVQAQRPEFGASEWNRQKCGLGVAAHSHPSTQEGFLEKAGPLYSLEPASSGVIERRGSDN